MTTGSLTTTVYGYNITLGSTTLATKVTAATLESDYGLYFTGRMGGGLTGLPSIPDSAEMPTKFTIKNEYYKGLAYNYNINRYQGLITSSYPDGGICIGSMTEENPLHLVYKKLKVMNA
jgi:hypothetical protein